MFRIYLLQRVQIPYRKTSFSFHGNSPSGEHLTHGILFCICSFFYIIPQPAETTTTFFNWMY